MLLMSFGLALMADREEGQEDKDNRHNMFALSEHGSEHGSDPGASLLAEEELADLTEDQINQFSQGSLSSQHSQAAPAAWVGLRD